MPLWQLLFQVETNVSIKKQAKTQTTIFRISAGNRHSCVWLFDVYLDESLSSQTEYKKTETKCLAFSKYHVQSAEKSTDICATKMITIKKLAAAALNVVL